MFSDIALRIGRRSAPSGVLPAATSGVTEAALHPIALRRPAQDDLKPFVIQLAGCVAAFLPPGRVLVAAEEAAA
jgi:hypothetical protein